MKHSKITAGVVSLLIGASMSSLAGVPLDGVAAVVNKDTITFAQVREVTADAEAQARRELTGDALQSKLKEIRLKALSGLIERKRAEQAATK